MSKLITASVETLVAAGGSYWQSVDGERRRVYFNDILGLFGVQAQFYGTGNVQRATLDGDAISNSEFRKISADLVEAKIWVDLTDGRLLVQGFTSRYAGYDYVPHVAAAVRECIAATERLESTTATSTDLEEATAEREAIGAQMDTYADQNDVPQALLDEYDAACARESHVAMAAHQ